MTEKQKHDIVKLRIDGMKQKDIAEVTGVGESVVKTLCAKYSIKPGVRICANCFSELPRYSSKFCSRECMINWWKLHRKEQPHREFHFVCQHCKKEFVRYRNDHPKYCSHDCYIKERYMKEDKNG